MNTLKRETKVDKLNNNKKRLTYLKLMSVISLLIDLITFIALSSIELYFDNYKDNMDLLFYYLAKVIIFLALGGFILISIIYQKQTMLLISAIIYFVLGLGLLFYLLIIEMTSSKNIQQMKESKPDFYFDVILKILIPLNIIGGVFRMLGVIFMLIYIRITRKIVKLTKELNESLLDKDSIFLGYNIQDTHKNSKISSIKTTYNSFAKTPLVKSSTFSEGKTFRDLSSKRTNFIPVPKLNNAESTSHVINENSGQSDLSIFINNGHKSNNIFLSVFNYNMNENQNNINLKMNSVLQVATSTYDSNDREKNFHIESLYETPKDINLLK